MSNIKKVKDAVFTVIALLLVALTFLAIPIVLTVGSWFLLAPSTFWQKLAWIICAAIADIIIIIVELFLVIASGK